MTRLKAGLQTRMTLGDIVADARKRMADKAARRDLKQLMCKHVWERCGTCSLCLKKK